MNVESFEYCADTFDKCLSKRVLLRIVFTPKPHSNLCSVCVYDSEGRYYETKSCKQTFDYYKTLCDENRLYVRIREHITFSSSYITLEKNVRKYTTDKIEVRYHGSLIDMNRQQKCLLRELDKLNKRIDDISPNYPTADGPGEYVLK